MARASGSVRKAMKGSSDDDRISNLPDSMIFHILSFLQTKDVVVTSVLSKRWKSFWTKVNTLEFKSRDEDKKESKGNKSMTFPQFVNNVLFRNDAQHLDKFRLRWIDSGCNAWYVNMWVNQAIIRNVRYLCLRVDNSDIRLPSNLFTSGTLETLLSQGHFLFKVPQVVCLPKLKVLGLNDVIYESAESFQTLISSCPVLEHLFIQCSGLHDSKILYKISSASLRTLHMCSKNSPAYRIQGTGKLEIDAPLLEWMYLEDYNWKEFSVTCPASLTNVILSFNLSGCPFDIGRCNLITNLIKTLNNVRSLELKGTIIKALSYTATPMSTTFERLTKLDIHCGCGEWSCLSSVLQCVNELQVLKFTKARCDQLCAHGECWSEPKDIPKCLSTRSLEEISFRGFQGLKDEIGMVSYVLKHGLGMRRIDLSSGVCEPKEELQILKKVMAIPSCSPASCEIYFNRDALPRCCCCRPPA
ncbi:OLC1v1010416C1 [Oldenlandia corymbosa var. corymbosa]|uniref:OLC1v1010416C1 n=1 Tax=Oldenlandia corymbosa var. corymbosa TaxID=529605 RepID=A0AAV1DR99_OLDCO|nr:OLC1v1010416C1 [Oldenlandia corymbosa var. corymbosa]